MSDLIFGLFILILVCGAIYFGIQSGKHTVSVREGAIQDCKNNGIQWSLAELAITDSANTALTSGLKEGIKTLQRVKDSNDFVKISNDGSMEFLADGRYETTTEFGSNQKEKSDD